MIRWYDYIAAFLAADFLLTNTIVALDAAKPWYVNFFGALCVYFVWDLWNDTYIPFRKRQEENK